MGRTLILRVETEKVAQDGVGGTCKLQLANCVVEYTH